MCSVECAGPALALPARHQCSTGAVRRLLPALLLRPRSDVVPVLAALGLTFLCMWLLNKKVNALWIILGMFVVGILGRWAHILGVPGA